MRTPFSVLPAAALLLATAVLLLTVGCASLMGEPWTLAHTQEHTALLPDASLAHYERGRGATRERRIAVLQGKEEHDVYSVDDLLEFCRPLTSAETAISYLTVVRILRLPDSGVSGSVIRFDPALTGPGASGAFSRGDAERWEVSTSPTSRPFAGGIEVTHVVLIPPVQHPTLNHSTPWRLVERVEVVYPNGTVSVRDERSLANGDHARQYASF